MKLRSDGKTAIYECDGLAFRFVWHPGVGYWSVTACGWKHELRDGTVKWFANREGEFEVGRFVAIRNPICPDGWDPQAICRVQRVHRGKLQLELHAPTGCLRDHGDGLRFLAGFYHSVRRVPSRVLEG